MEKKSIAQTLRDLEVGGCASFPIEQAGSLRTIIYRDLAVDRCNGKKFTTSHHMQTKSIIVTRVA